VPVFVLKTGSPLPYRRARARLKRKKSGIKPHPAKNLTPQPKDSAVSRADFIQVPLFFVEGE
jgi:hypothetical protein